MATDSPSEKLSTSSESEETTEVIEKRLGFCMRYREMEDESGRPACSHLSSPMPCAAAAKPEDFAAVASRRQSRSMPATVLTRDPPRSQAGDAPKASSGYISGGFAQAKGALREFEMNTTPSLPASVHETANTSAEINCAIRVPFVQRRAAARGLQEQTDGAHAPAQPLPVVVEKNRATASFAERRFAARFPDEFSGMKF